MVERFEIERVKEGEGWRAKAWIAPASPLWSSLGVAGNDKGPRWILAEGWSPEIALEKVMTKLGQVASRLTIPAPPPVDEPKADPAA